MSLLIKALDKAEAATSRREAQNLVGEAEATHAEEVNMARASNVFSAKQTPAKPANTMAWIMGIGLLALLGIGGYFYYQLNKLNKPAMPTPSVSASKNQVTIPPSPEVAAKKIAELIQVETPEPVNNAVQPISAEGPSTNENSADAESPVLPVNQTTTETTQIAAPVDQSQADKKVLPSTFKTAEKSVPEQAEIEQAKPQRKAARKPSVSRAAMLGTSKPIIASNSASIKIAKSKRSRGIQPAILDAYDAYNAGRDEDAKALYKKVLKQDVHNVDALLGMGAIAEKQGRISDAMGWYQKVLAVEPRNPVALSAYYDGKLEAGNKEQKLKTLIAQQPQNANAYVDLAHYYADQQQWALAQQSYFDAYRLNASAENALNLAISLDQMGKTQLALDYYKKALLSMENHVAAGVDTAAIQARVHAIEVN